MINRKKKIIFAAVIALIVLLLFFRWYDTEVASKYYVKFDGEYYDVKGAVITEEQVVEEVGAIERITYRTLWNRDGDSNFSFEGARIVKTAEGKLFVEMKFVRAETGETDSNFWFMEPTE